MRTTVDSQILSSLSDLEKTQKGRVLAFIKSLLKKSNGDKSKLVKFAGAFDQQDLLQMESAINQGCENIDRNEW